MKAGMDADEKPNFNMRLNILAYQIIGSITSVNQEV